MALPSASVMRTDGMTTVGSTPATPAGGEPATLSAKSTAMAPAFCAFFALTTNPQVPRSTSAILPAREFVIGEQASVVDGPAASAGSMPRAICPVTPGDDRGGPNCAVPTAYPPAIEAGAVTRSRGEPRASTAGTAAFTVLPFQTTRPLFFAEITRSAFVMLGQSFPVEMSRICRE